MELDVFKYNDQPVRTVVEDGEPWFVATDVAKILGYRDAANMTRRLDADEKGYSKVSTPSGDQQMLTINESGMYNAIFRSNSEGAKPFRKWITDDVIPSIRKTGGYSVSSQAPVLTDEQIVAQALQITTQKVAALEAKVEQDRPAVEYHEKFVARHDLVTIRTLANQINVKESVIRDALVDRGWLYRHSFERMNSKGQKVTEYKYGVYSPYKKYFVLVNNHTAPRLFGEVRTTVKVTPAGVQAVEKMFAVQEILEVA